MNSNVTLQQLIYIVAVDSHGSFVEAAQECKVSQPALSMQIRKLENTLGVTLFDRSRQPVRPTEIGRRIVAQARLVLREAGRIQETVDASQGEMRGEYYLGADRSLASWLLPSILRDFTNRHPDVTVTVHELRADELAEGLQRHDFDAAITPLPVSVPGIVERRLYNEPFTALIPRTHPLYTSERISQSDLAGQSLLLPADVAGSRERGLGIQANTRSDERVPIRWEGGTYESCVRLAEQGLGIALVPHLVATALRATGVADMLRDFADTPPYRTVGIVHGGDHTKGHITEALASVIVSGVPAAMLEGV